jgi:PKD repeat protein
VYSIRLTAANDGGSDAKIRQAAIRVRAATASHSLSPLPRNSQTTAV